MHLVSPDELLNIRASRGIASDYTYGTVYQPSPLDYQSLYLISKYDPIIDTALQLTVDMTTLNGYELISDAETKETENYLSNILDLDQEIDNIIYQLLIFGDAYLELVFSGNYVTEIHTLESRDMRKQFDIHGAVTAYVMTPRDSNFKEIVMAPETVVNFSFRKNGSAQYSDSMLFSIADAWVTRKYSMSYLKNLILNNPARIMHFLRGADKVANNQFKLDIQAARQKHVADMSVYGGVQSDYKAIEVGGKFDPAFSQILTDLRKEVLSVTRVPPHWVGMLDGANRGIGENVTIPFDARIKKLQQKVNSQINKDLFPRLGIKNTTYRLKPPTISDEKLIWQNAQIMSGIGVDGESILTYVRSKGVQISKKAEIVAKVAQQAGTPDSGKMAVNLNKDGTSDEGMRKLTARSAEAGV